MAQKVLLGIDIGTQGTKGALFDVRGRCLAETFHSSRLHRPSPEVVEEDPEIQLDSVCSVMKGKRCQGGALRRIPCANRIRVDRAAGSELRGV